jgi:hypothetical protein
MFSMSPTLSMTVPMERSAERRSWLLVCVMSL